MYTNHTGKLGLLHHRHPTNDEQSTKLLLLAQDIWCWSQIFKKNLCRKIRSLESRDLSPRLTP
jgi:hypothetical protein